MIDNDLSPKPLNPDARKNVLRIFRGNESMVLPPLLTNEQMQVAERSEADFKRSVQSVLDRSPKTIFNAFSDFEAVLPREKTREILDRALDQEPFLFIAYFGRTKKYYDAEEQKTSFLRANELDRGHALFRYFGDPAINQLFSKEEGRDLLLAASKTMYGGSFEKDNVDSYVKGGFLTQGDVRGIVVSLLQRDREFVKGVGNFVTYFPEDQKEVFKKEVINAYKKEDLSLFNLKSTGDLLTDEDRRVIIRYHMQSKPDVMGYHLGIMEELLPRDEVQAWVRKALAKKYFTIFSSDFASKALLDKDMLSPEERSTFRRIVISEHPGMVFSNLDDYLSDYPLEKRGAVLRQIIEDNPQSALYNISEWISYISTDPVEQKAFVKSMLYEDGLYFVVRYNDEREGNIIRTLFTRDEIRQLMHQQLELGAEYTSSTFKDVSKFLGNDREIKEFVEKARETDPSYFMSNLKNLMYLYTSDEIRTVVNELSQNSRSVYSVLSQVDEWAPILGKDYVWNFIQKLRVTNPQDVFLQIDDCMRFVPREEKEGFLMDLIRINPPFAFLEIDKIRHYLPEITEDKMLILGQSDSERLAYAPKALASFYKDIVKVKDPVNRQVLTRDAYQLYHSIALIESLGLKGELMRVKSAQELPARREEELLSIFYCYSMLKSKDPENFSKLWSLGNSVEDSSRILLGELARHMGIQREVSEDEGKNFLTSMGTPSPFFTYFLQYENSPEYKRLLAGMFEGILAGKYNEWKFGERTNQCLDELKKAKLVPESMTYEQYEIWRTDQETTLQEALATDASSVASAIRKVLLDNNEHLQVEAFDEKEKTPEQVLIDIQSRLGLVGQDLASINKRMSELKKVSGSEENKDIMELLAQKERIEEARKRLIKNRNFVKVATLKPQEIVVGYLLEGADLKKKVALITKVLEDIRKETSQEGQFVFEQVEQLLKSFYGQSKEKQNLTCSDSSSPKDLIEVGARPVESCQHYATGSHNDCLLGYSDPNTKILMLKNEKGNPVARAIFRLLSSREGKPALHVEKIYSVSASQGVLKSTFKHALSKAMQMGVPLFVNQEAQNEQGVETELQVPAGFTTIEVNEQLFSKGSRAPKVYVDSAGGERKRGNYRMENLLQVKEVTV